MYVCEIAESVYGEQLYVENQSGTARDSRLGEPAVAHFGRELDFPAVAHLHLLQRNYPALYKIAQAHCRRCPATA